MLQDVLKALDADGDGQIQYKGMQSFDAALAEH